MAYIGNTLRTAQPNYQIIDDISASFDGSTTSFALQVGGVTPAPFPVNAQHCLISVGGVVQQPDPTGTDGFLLSGSNIVFSAAPSAGENFFGVVLAGADYINVGAEFPDGSVANPSITFDSDRDTGLYRKGANNIAITTNGTERVSVGTSEVVFNAGGEDIDFRIEGDTESSLLFVDAGNDTVSFRDDVTIDSSGRLLVGTSSSRTVGGNITGKLQIEGTGTGGSTTACTVTQNSNDGTGGRFMLAKSRGTSNGSVTLVQSGDTLGMIDFAGADGTDAGSSAVRISAQVDGTPGANDMPGRLVFSTTADGASSPTARFEINNEGKNVIGVTTSRVRLTPHDIKYPLEVVSSNDSLSASGLWSNYGLGWYNSFVGGAGDNSSTSAVQFEVISSTSQSYPIMIYVIATGCNSSTSSPSPLSGWRLYSARIYNGTIDNVTLRDSGGSAVTTSIIQQAALTYNGVANGACRFKVYANTSRQETTVTAWIDYRLATIRTTRLAS